MVAGTGVLEAPEALDVSVCSASKLAVLLHLVAFTAIFYALPFLHQG